MSESQAEASRQQLPDRQGDRNVPGRKKKNWIGIALDLIRAIVIATVAKLLAALIFRDQ